jgi:hypothetical protein
MAEQVGWMNAGFRKLPHRPSITREARLSRKRVLGRVTRMWVNRIGSGENAYLQLLPCKQPQRAAQSGIRDGSRLDPAPSSVTDSKHENAPDLTGRAARRGPARPDVVGACANCAQPQLNLTGGGIPISLSTLPPSESRPITAVGWGSTSFAGSKPPRSRAFGQGHRVFFLVVTVLGRAPGRPAPA